MPTLITSNPTYRKHSGGQAFVSLGGKRCYLGPHGTAASRREYDRLIGQWLANGRRLPGKPADDTTVKELIVAFWKHAQVYHVSANGHRGELSHYRAALRRLKRLYADTLAADFGPLALKAVRNEMVVDGWTRNYVNGQVRRLQRVFKWGTENELVPATVHQALVTIAGLRAGKCVAPESKPIRPVAEEHVAAVVARVPPPVAAMIGLQQLTGMRPGEVCQMRPCDIDRSVKLWVYRPGTHKTQYQGHERAIYLGEQCQAILSPLMERDRTAHLFSPAESMAWIRAARTAARKTPLSCGNRAGSHVQQRARTKPGERYTTASYQRAIKYACDQALPPAPLGPRPRETKKAWRARLTDAQRAEFAAWRDEHRWHPNQLRHNFATFARREYGLEAAQVLLGHKTLTVTQVYAERNVAAAQAVMAKVG